MSMFVQLLQAGIPEAHLLTQHKFDEERGWRFDLAIVVLGDRSRSPKRRRIGIEIDGNGPNHMGYTGYREDRLKDHAAYLAGWSVVRFTTEMVTKSDYALKLIMKLYGTV